MRKLLALATLCLIAAVSACGGASSAGSCAAPQINTSVGHVALGDQIVIQGKNYFDGCGDFGSHNSLTGRTTYEDVSPRTGIEVTISQEDEPVTQFTADADEFGAWEKSVDITDDFVIGFAEVSADDVFFTAFGVNEN
ncbi:hypothetical protein ACFSYH_00940 [Populibacterium corticicola]|uniref:Uncharacterized protein n=1 Tax=Populibacterium corticicola TaxID=1812826 RepID=A0ABW5XD69_9MICO